MGGRALDMNAYRHRFMHDHSVVTAADGSFAIHGFAEGRGQLRMELKREGYASMGGAPLSTGAEQARLVMGRVGVVHGKIDGMTGGGHALLAGAVGPARIHRWRS